MSLFTALSNPGPLSLARFPNLPTPPAAEAGVSENVNLFNENVSFRIAG